MNKTKKWLAACLILVWASGCRRELDKPLRFVVPKGFDGPFVLIERVDAPKEVANEPSAYVIRVPASGILPLGDGWVLHRFHYVQAEYVDGGSIPAGNFLREGFGIFSGPSGLYGNGGPSDPRTVYYHWYYVGSRRDARGFLQGAESNRRQDKWLLDHGINPRLPAADETGRQ